MEEHAKWYPQCPHIMLVKGRDYSDMLIRGEKSVVDSAKLTADKVNNTKKIQYLCIRPSFLKALERRLYNKNKFFVVVFIVVLLQRTLP